MRKLFLTLWLAAVLPVMAQQSDSEDHLPRKLVRQQLNEAYRQRVAEGDFVRHYVELRLGDPLMAEMASSIFSPKCDCELPLYEIYKADIWTGHDVQPWRTSSYVLPAFSMSYHYAFYHWLHFGPALTYFSLGDTYTDLRTRAPLYSNSVHYFTLMGDVRFQYLDRRVVGLYSGVALGVGLGVEHWSKRQSVHVTPAWQLTALGLRVGDRVYWNMELGFGVEGFGQTGIGVRW